jgi:acyl carrier protein
MMQSEAAIRATLRTWILEANGVIAPGALRDDTPILEDRVLTSVDIVELIVLIEELSGAAIDIERLDPAAFRDIDSIYGAFFAPAGGTHGR